MAGRYGKTLLIKPKKVSRPCCPVHSIPFTEKHSAEPVSAGGWRWLYCRRCRGEALEHLKRGQRSVELGQNRHEKGVILPSLPLAIGFTDGTSEDVVMGSLNDWIDEEKRLRMVKGEMKHGPLNLETDPRNFIQEGVEELLDCLNYIELSMLQGRLPFCKWVSIDKDVRFIIWKLNQK